MVEEENRDDVRLFLENKKDIDAIKGRVEKLLLTDSNLYHKMDKLQSSFEHMEEGFSHSRETGHKTWEASQEVLGKIGELVNEVSHNKILIKATDKKTDDTYRTLWWLIKGTILIVFAYIFVAVIGNGIIFQ